MWKKIFDSIILKRGELLARNGCETFQINDGKIFARIQGNSLYNIVIESDLTSATCSCPYSNQHQYCKHIAAALFINDNNRLNNKEYIEIDEKSLPVLLENKIIIEKQKQELLLKKKQENEAQKKQLQIQKKVLLNNKTELKKSQKKEELLKAKLKEKEEKRKLLEKEENYKKQELIERICVLNIEGLDNMTLEQLKALKKERLQEINEKHKLILKEKRRLETEKKRKALEKAREEETLKKKRAYEELISKLTPLDKNEKNEITITTGDYVSLIVSPSVLSRNLFGCNTFAQCRNGFFIPKSLLGQFKGKYIVWYTQFNTDSNRYHNGQIWTDIINDTQDYIVRSYVGNVIEALNEKDIKWTDSKFIVLGRENGLYKFFGIFEIDNVTENGYIKIFYKRISNKFTYKNNF